MSPRPSTAGHAGGVGAGEVVTVAQRDAGGDLDLAAEVEQERAVADLAHLDAVERLEGVAHLVAVGSVGDVAADVDDDVVCVGLHDVEGGHGRAGPSGGGGELAGDGEACRGLHTQDHRVSGTGRGHGSSRGCGATISVASWNETFVLWILWEPAEVGKDLS